MSRKNIKKQVLGKINNLSNEELKHHLINPKDSLDEHFIKSIARWEKQN